MADDEQYRLHFDEDAPISGPSRVRVIILMPGTAQQERRAEPGDMEEAVWLRAAEGAGAWSLL